MYKISRRDYLKRFNLYNKELDSIIYKNFFKNEFFNLSVRWNALSKFQLNCNTKIINKVIYSNQCLISKKKSKFNKYFKFSRLIFLRYARLGKLSNIKKSCW